LNLFTQHTLHLSSSSFFLISSHIGIVFQSPKRDKNNSQYGILSVDIPKLVLYTFFKGGEQMLGIEAERLARNMSIAAFGEIFGVAPHTVFRWEREERSPSLDILKKMAVVSGKSSDYLVNPTQPSTNAKAKPSGARAKRRETVETATAGT
jgi:DNA-binding XRE family transcriptional regulator